MNKSSSGAEAATGAAEFDSLAEVAMELGLSPSDVPRVVRRGVNVQGDQHLSAVQWQDKSPDVVFIHGGGQNARTWDLVAMQLGRPAVAIDLPGHGHSSWRADHDYGPWANAEAVAVAIENFAPQAQLVVGMSLGGLTTMRLSAARPDLVSKSVIVDVLPGSREAHQSLSQTQKGTTALVAGPSAFDTQQEMIDRAIAASPRRSAQAVRRGVVHNSRQLDDGRWAWRYDDQISSGQPDYRPLWADVSASTVPMLLVKGGESAFVTQEDLTELSARRPDARIEVVTGAGHSVQSDQPVALSSLILGMLDS